MYTYRSVRIHVFRHTEIDLYAKLIMCMHIKFYKSDIHIQFYFLLKLKMAWLNFCVRANTPIPQKKPSVISVSQIPVITSHGLAGFRLIQTFFLPPGVFWREKPSETKKQALAHGKDVDLSSIHTLRYTWLLQGNKKLEVFSRIETSLFPLQVEGMSWSVS